MEAGPRNRAKKTVGLELGIPAHHPEDGQWAQNHNGDPARHFSVSTLPVRETFSVSALPKQEGVGRLAHLSECPSLEKSDEAPHRSRSTKNEGRDEKTNGNGNSILFHDSPFLSTRPKPAYSFTCSNTFLLYTQNTLLVKSQKTPYFRPISEKKSESSLPPRARHSPERNLPSFMFITRTLFRLFTVK